MLLHSPPAVIDFCVGLVEGFVTGLPRDVGIAAGRIADTLLAVFPPPPPLIGFTIRGRIRSA